MTDRQQDQRYAEQTRRENLERASQGLRAGDVVTIEGFVDVNGDLVKIKLGEPQ